MLCIVDYGLGNLGSIKNMLKKVGVPAQISSLPDDIVAADKLILPGVGAFDAGMANLHARGLVPVLEEQVFERKKPVLGICLGMQLMSKGSEEGQQRGLGWIDAETRRFDFSALEQRLPVPLMGWNEVTVEKSEPLVSELPPEPRFYFVHSYHVVCANPGDIMLTATYGLPFTAGFAHGNILGVQFHPEKSHKFGMALLQAFAKQ